MPPIAQHKEVEGPMRNRVSIETLITPPPDHIKLVKAKPSRDSSKTMID
ncbi:hypothetical protein SynNOUM97013_01533 [Synechococcus sp. NOUM97013]|nr:hypothetical protein SynNOUM97013_01533 [Synechococcus sp. NOUM97013]